MKGQGLRMPWTPQERRQTEVGRRQDGEAGRLGSSAPETGNLRGVGMGERRGGWNSERPMWPSAPDHLI